jgi:hypothetical protein
MMINNCHDFLTITALGRIDLTTAALGRGKVGINKASRSIERVFDAQCMGNICHRLTQYRLSTSSLEAVRHRLVVRVELRQHVPLRPGIEYFKDVARSGRLAITRTRSNLLIWKVSTEFVITVRRLAVARSRLYELFVAR